MTFNIVEIKKTKNFPFCELQEGNSALRTALIS